VVEREREQHWAAGQVSAVLRVVYHSRFLCCMWMLACVDDDEILILSYWDMPFFLRILCSMLQCFVFEFRVCEPVGHSLSLC
jgi:hypothetical protein